MSQTVTVVTLETQLAPPGPFNWIHLYNSSASTVYISYDGNPATLASAVPLAANGFIRFDNGNKPILFARGITAITASGSATVVVAWSAAFSAPALTPPPVIPYDPATDFSRDDIESYSIATDLAALDGGLFWVAPYVSRSNYMVVADTLETYTASADVHGLNAGELWTSAYVSRSNYLVVEDTLESYSAGAALDTLNAGTNWDAAFVSRP